jgi:signal transduction histidine kinase
VPPDVAASLAQILSYLNQAADEGRQLIRFVEGLPAGETVNVVDTLEKTCDLLTRKTTAGRPQIIFQRPDHPWPQLLPKTAWTVVRIVQQAAQNSVRHSGAGHLVVTLSGTCDAGLKVVVRDDGHGFDPTGEFPGHYGLKSMRQRAREIGLELTIESHPGGGGTRISLAIPPAALAADQDALGPPEFEA